MTKPSPEAVAAMDAILAKHGIVRHESVPTHDELRDVLALALQRVAERSAYYGTVHDPDNAVRLALRDGVEGEGSDAAAAPTSDRILGSEANRHAVATSGARADPSTPGPERCPT